MFYVFHRPPMLFNPVAEARLRAAAATPRSTSRSSASSRRPSRRGARGRQEAFARRARRRARPRGTGRSGVPAARGGGQGGRATRAIDLVKRTTGDGSYTDVNYIFPTFITTAMPIGLVGLWIVAIITAAMDSIAAELNSLATATVIDFYKRHYRPAAEEAHYLTVSKVATGLWGVFACWVAVYASTLGSLIEVVNRFGSFFYGSILGVFALAILARRASGTGAFVGLIAGMSAVAAVAFGRPDISFLWHNVIGAVVVFRRRPGRQPDRAGAGAPGRIVSGRGAFRARGPAPRPAGSGRRRQCPGTRPASRSAKRRAARRPSSRRRGRSGRADRWPRRSRPCA